MGPGGVYSPGRDSGTQRSSGVVRPGRAAGSPACLPSPRPCCRRARGSSSLPSGSAARPALPCPPRGCRLCPVGSRSSYAGQGHAARCQEPRTLRPQRCINGFRVDRRVSRAHRAPALGGRCPRHRRVSDGSRDPARSPEGTTWAGPQGGKRGGSGNNRELRWSPPGHRSATNLFFPIRPANTRVQGPAGD